MWLKGGMDGPITRSCEAEVQDEETFNMCMLAKKRWENVQSLVKRQAVDDWSGGERALDIKAARDAILKKKQEAAAKEKAMDQQSDTMSPKLTKMFKDEKEYTVNGTKMLNDMTASLTRYTSKDVLNITALIGNKLNLPDIDFEKGLEKGLEEAQRNPDLPANSVPAWADPSTWHHSWVMKPHPRPPAGLASVQERQRLLMTTAHDDRTEGNTILDFSGMLSYLEKEGRDVFDKQPPKQTLSSAPTQQLAAAPAATAAAAPVDNGKSLHDEIQMLHRILVHAKQMSIAANSSASEKRDDDGGETMLVDKKMAALAESVAARLQSAFVSAEAIASKEKKVKQDKAARLEAEAEQFAKVEADAVRN